MLNIYSQPSGGFCDGVSRRNFLKIGGLAMGGISLNDVLRAESAQKVGKSHKAVIMIFLPGGPSHQDMFDMKPDAPSEIRGEFLAIDTAMDGLAAGELCLVLVDQVEEAMAHIAKRVALG